MGKKNPGERFVLRAIRGPEDVDTYYAVIVAILCYIHKSCDVFYSPFPSSLRSLLHDRDQFIDVAQ